MQRKIKLPTKKTTKKTTAAMDKAPEVAIEEVVVETTIPNVIKETTTPVVRKKYEKDDQILCRSVTVGGLVCSSPKDKGRVYRWSDYGDVAWVDYADLVALQSRKSGFVYNPQFIIEDEQLVEDWKLEDVYSTFYGIDNPTAFFRLPPAEIKKRLNEAPQGLKEAIKSVAAQCVKNGTLDSINVIKAVDAVLGTQLLTFVN